MFYLQLTFRLYSLCFVQLNHNDPLIINLFISIIVVYGKRYRCLFVYANVAMNLFPLKFRFENVFHTQNRFEIKIDGIMEIKHTKCMSFTVD